MYAPDAISRSTVLMASSRFGLALIAGRRRSAGAGVTNLGPVQLLERDHVVEDRAERLGVLLVDDGDERRRVVLELAQHRREQQLSDLQPLVGLFPQLDELEHAVRFVAETRERRASRGPDHSHVMAEPAHLVLHQLTVLRAEAVLVTMQQVAKLDVVEARIVALGPRRQIHAHRTVRGPAQAWREGE